VKVLGWASLLNDIATEMVYPLLSDLLLLLLHGSRAHLGTWLGAIDGTAESISSFVKLWSGHRSDRGGTRKGFVVFGYALGALTRPLAGVAAAAWHLFGLRVAERIGKGVRNPPRDALIAESTAPAGRGRAFGFNQAMDHLGAAIGPLAAAAFLWFYPNALRQLFLWTLVPGLTVVVLLVIGLRSPKGPASVAAPGGHGPWTVRPFGRSFRLYLVALVVFTLGNSSDLFLLTRARQLGVAVWLLPILWCTFGLAKGAGNMVTGRLVDRIGPRPMILAGWLFYAAVYFAFAFATAAWHVWALFFAYSIFYALTEPSEKTLVANLVGKENRGLAYGWYNAAIGIATLPASLLFGKLYDVFGAATAFGTGAGLALAAALLLACCSTTRKETIGFPGCRPTL
jgi:MFS family permease